MRRPHPWNPSKLLRAAGRQELPSAPGLRGVELVRQESDGRRGAALWHQFVPILSVGCENGCRESSAHRGRQCDISLPQYVIATFVILAILRPPAPRKSRQSQIGKSRRHFAVLCDPDGFCDAVHGPAGPATIRPAGQEAQIDFGLMG